MPTVLILNSYLPLEHPRAGTTDDVECFFSVLRYVVGKDFTLKQVCPPLVLYMLYSQKLSLAITSSSTYAMSGMDGGRYVLSL